MAIGGDGPWVVGVMWMLTGVSLFFVVLRIYARLIVVQIYGIEDHAYNFAFILLLGYTIFTTVAAHYGFGQSMEDLPGNDPTNGVFFLAIGQAFAIIGMGVAKVSMGFFLLRFVIEMWQSVAIWILMTSLLCASVSTCFVFWLQYPRAVSFTLSVLGIVVDFSFALLPWILLWNLQMPQREKIIIGASMSLGIFSAACGIKRTIEIPHLTDANYLKDVVPVIIWTAAETGVTMVCIGVPVCRALYKRQLDKFISWLGSASGLNKQAGASILPSFVLKSFGGGTMPGPSRQGAENVEATTSAVSNDMNKDRGAGGFRQADCMTSAVARSSVTPSGRDERLGIAGLGSAV